MDIKDKVKEFYTFIFKEDSIPATITFVLVSLLFIRFIFFPLLSLGAGTALPIVVVISDSMSHSDTWEEEVARCTDGLCTQKEYYEEKHMWDDFSSFPLSNGFNRGDIVLSTKTGQIKKGDVLIFTSPQAAYPVIHRVVDKTSEGYVTKGDNNPEPNPSIGEENLSEQNVVASARIRIPYLGYVKLVVVDALLYIQSLFS